VNRKKASSREVIDVHALAQRQLDLDRERTARFPELFSRKLERMSASPLAFLRGAAPLFYEMLARRPDLAGGPPGEGVIVGDLHLENFGAYRRAPGSKGAKKHDVAFNLNDFDDAIVAPWRLDLLRLTTSLILGGRELGADGRVVLDLSDRLLGAWVRAVFDGKGTPKPPPPVASLVLQVSERSKKALLDGRTEVVHGRRRFVRGSRYADLPKDIARAAPKAFAEYLASVAKEERPPEESCEILDVALRIAGTGSLGALRIAVLTAGKGADSAFIFDLKEAGAPSAAVLRDATVSRRDEAAPEARVVRGFRACIEQPPRALGTAMLRDVHLYGRRLAPQEDKLDLRHLRATDLPALADYLGALVGAAHVRGATAPPSKRWTTGDCDALRSQAITLAGIHEALYIALCDRMRALLPQDTARRRKR
jgi:uncharacterized protein (DUF2252 family)